jgi:oxygen-independent coproporphyrinogen-3 oxidase
MIQLTMNELHYEYDIRGLLMSFYPGRDIVCEVSETPSGKEFELQVKYLKDSIEVMILDKKEILPIYWEEKDAKNELKRCIYRMLSRIEGKQLPWGTLTGIRPVKLPMAMLEQGKDEEEIKKALFNTYYISEEKAKLSIQIAKKELQLLNKLDYEKGYSLYIGIPFCPTTCLYCSFTSYAFSRFENKIWDYLHALEKEILYTAKKFKDKKLNSIYFGGGTPTTLQPEQLDWLLQLIVDNFDLSNCLEWTVEGGRPDSITREKLQVLRKYPVDRISINPQTMKEETLKIIGRKHTVRQVKEAYQMAREEGFDNINMDLILGLPEEDAIDVKNTMEELKLLAPDNLTVHTLAIKRASRLNMEKEQYSHLHLEKNTQEMMQITMDYAKEMGLEPYYLYRQKNMSGNLENIGYAKSGMEGVYNILIMEEKQTIVACGAGSVTKRVDLDGKIERASNVKDIEQYISRIDEMIERKEKLWE